MDFPPFYWKKLSISGKGKILKIFRGVKNRRISFLDFFLRTSLTHSHYTVPETPKIFYGMRHVFFARLNFSFCWLHYFFTDRKNSSAASPCADERLCIRNLVFTFGWVGNIKLKRYLQREREPPSQDFTLCHFFVMQVYFKL